MDHDDEIAGESSPSRSARSKKNLDRKLMERMMESTSDAPNTFDEPKAAPGVVEQQEEEGSENSTSKKQGQLPSTTLGPGQERLSDQILTEMKAAREAEATRSTQPGVVNGVTPGYLLPGEARMGSSIAQNVKSCFQSFHNLHAAVMEVSEQGLDTLGQMSPDWIKDTLDRFKLWSQNIGAHHTGRRSLDYRLRDASNLQNQAIDLVRGMGRALDDAWSIVSGTSVPWDRQELSDESDSMSSFSDADEDTNTAQDRLTDESPSIPVDSELTQIMMEIVDIIDCLLRLSISVQNPAPHDRFTAAKYTDTSFYEAIDVEHVRAKYSAATEELLERLGKANSHRRQYFKYRDAHHQKLAWGLDQLETNLQAGQSTVASSIPLHLKTIDASGEIASSFSVLQEDQRSDTGYSQTSYATSTTASERLRVPNIPEAHSRGPFECPFCFMMISVSTTYAWKKHVFSDLRPYICLETSCETPHQEYSRRHQWYNHLVQSHWRIWSCPLNCDEEMPSADALRAHLLKTHRHFLHTEEIEFAVEKSGTKPKHISQVSCPLCQEVLMSNKMYVKHVGKHQEDLALFALPKLEVSEDECSVIAEGMEDTASEMLDSENDNLKAEPGVPDENDETDTQGRGFGEYLERAVSIPPPESSASSDEDDLMQMRGRQIENLKELQEAISQIPQHREDLPKKSGEQEMAAKRTTSPIPDEGFVKSDEFTSVQPSSPAAVARNLNDRSNTSADRDFSRAQENFNSNFDVLDRSLLSVVPSLTVEQQDGSMTSAVGKDEERGIPRASPETLLERPSGALSLPSRPAVQPSSSEQDNALYKSAGSIGSNTSLDSQDDSDDRRETRSTQPWSTEPIEEHSEYMQPDAEYREVKDQQFHEKLEKESKERRQNDLEDFESLEAKMKLLRERLKQGQEGLAVTIEKAREFGMVRKDREVEEAKARQEMRDHLLAAGVAESQIQAMIDGKRTRPTDSKTTYTRMARKHLSIRALRSRAIEHELDKNPDYIIIRRWVPPEEQKELWALTRVIRDDRERAVVAPVASSRHTHKYAEARNEESSP